MKIIVTRKGIEKLKVNTGAKFDDKEAIRFLAKIFEKDNQKKEEEK